MIQKPKNWDNIKPNDFKFEEPEPGAYICKIVNVNLATSKKAGKPMLVVHLDIKDDGKFDGFFAKDEAMKIGKGWSNITWRLTRWLMLDFDDPNNGNFFSSAFRGFIDAVTDSNQNWSWDFANEKCLEGKKVVALVCIEESEKDDGSVRRNYKVANFYSIPQFKNGNVGKAWLKKADGTKITYKKRQPDQPRQAADKSDGWFGEQSDDDVDIPFD